MAAERTTGAQFTSAPKTLAPRSSPQSAPSSRRSAAWGYLSLFSSLSTLFCCALPSLLVLLGLGATVASTLSALPWLVALSRHKRWVFAISGGLIALSFVQMYAIA